jgi:hypothetical protein
MPPSTPVKKALNKSFDRLRTNGKLLIPFMVSLSNALLSTAEGHERNQLNQSFLKTAGAWCSEIKDIKTQAGRDNIPPFRR